MLGVVLIHLEAKHQIMPNNGDSTQAHVFIIGIICLSNIINTIPHSLPYVTLCQD